jgi:hypothetical protein
MYKQRYTPEQQSGTASILSQGAGRTKKQMEIRSQPNMHSTDIRNLS